MRYLNCKIVLIFLLLFLFFGTAAFAEYLEPPLEISKILERSPLPEVTVSPDRRNLLLIQREGMPGIEELSRPYLALGGIRFVPGNLGPVADGRGSIAKISFSSIREGRVWDANLPRSVIPGMPKFSPDCRWIAFADMQPEGISLWIAEVATGRSRRLTGANLSLVTGSFFWMPDSSALICRMRPENAGRPPVEPHIPAGPVTQESSDVEAKVRTYQDLLKNPHDVELFDYYCTTQLVMVSIGAETAPIGKPSVFADVSVSPDGRYLFVVRVVKPYSYLVRWRHFSREMEIWTLNGKKIRTLASLERAEAIPIGGVPVGPRSLNWRADSPSTMVWAEALDGGDPKVEGPHRDRVMILEAPFRSNPRQLLQTSMRFRNILWSSGDKEFLFTYDNIRQWTRTWVFSIRNGELADNNLLWDRDRGDAYGDPGNLVGHNDSMGRLLVDERDGKVLLKGAGSSPEGDHPFLDEMEIATAKIRRIYQNSGDVYEAVVDVLDPRGREIVTRHETASSPPGYYFVNTISGEKRPLVEFEDPVPELAGVKKQIIRYLREDGIELSGTLYLPPSWKEGERLPLIMWAYPREFNNPRIAGQVRGTAFRFPIISGPSPLFFLLRGYAVLDGPAMPIVGEEGNDTFVEQLVMNAKAAVDKVVSLGVADRKRIGVGGHSYGAFMTANLLAHSDFFAAGIARSGAYNRTLTPFGFQNERRTFWEAPEIYFAMSPFMHADQINEPILLIHGEADNNSGTFPLQSDRMFHALKGLGGTARLVVLPGESHGYAARESVKHTVYEMLNWADRFLKGNQKQD
ncbi:MAG: prolyl oligopeptidase family serine peptidase [Acidobacteriota bacterium]